MEYLEKEIKLDLSKLDDVSDFTVKQLNSNINKLKIVFLNNGEEYNLLGTTIMATINMPGHVTDTCILETPTTSPKNVTYLTLKPEWLSKKGTVKVEFQISADGIIANSKTVYIQVEKSLANYNPITNPSIMPGIKEILSNIEAIKNYNVGQHYNVGDILKFYVPDQDDFGYAGGPALAICTEEFTATQDILNHLNIQLMPIATNKTNNDNIGIYPYNFYFSPVTTKDLEDNVYLKNEIDTKLNNIQINAVDLSNYYNKEEVNNEIDTKINAIEIPSTDLSNYYNKSEVDAKIPTVPDLPTEFGSGNGNNSLKQSLKCTADGQYSFAANIGNTQPIASGSAAFNQSIAGGMNQLTAGKFNIIDTNGDYAFIIGNGVNTLQRHNAATIDWFGMARFAGKVYANNNQELATREYADNLNTNMYKGSASDSTAGGDSAATGDYAFAVNESNANGNDSASFNHGTVTSYASDGAAFNKSTAGSPNQTTIGRFNKIDEEDEFAFIIGNGSDNLNRSNAVTIEWGGITRFAGKVFANNNQELATVEYADAKAGSCISIKEFKSGQVYNTGDVIKTKLPELNNLGIGASYGLFICYATFKAGTDNVNDYIGININPIPSYNYLNDGITLNQYSYYYSPVSTKDLEDNVYMKYEIDAKLGNVETLLDNINNTI